MGTKHRKQIRERLRNNEIDSYNFDTDVYGRIDAKMSEEEVNAARFGRLTKRDKDRIIQTQVDILLHKEHILVNEDGLQHHIEYILLIKLCRMLKQGTLTYEKFQRMKNRHREDVRLKLRRREITSYDFDRDVYGRLDAMMEDELRKTLQAQQLRAAPEEALPVIVEEPRTPPAPQSKPSSRPDTGEISFVVHLDSGTTGRAPESSPEQDNIVKKHVQFMIDETKPPVKPSKLQHHIEHVIMIKLDKLLQEGKLDFQSYDAEKNKQRAQMMSDFEAYDQEADIYSRLDQDLMAQQKRPRKKGEGEANKDLIIQTIVGELIKEAKMTPARKDIRYHEEHILPIRMGSYLKSGTLTFQKYTEMKNKHHAQMRQKLLSNEIDYYSFDTDIFGRLDKLIIVEVEIVAAREKEEAEKAKLEREARLAAEAEKKEQERKEAIEKARIRREEREAALREQAAKDAAELAEREREEQEAAEKLRLERLAEKEKKERVDQGSEDDPSEERYSIPRRTHPSYSNG